MHDMDGRWTFNEKDYDRWGHEDFATKEEAIKAAREYLDDDQKEMYVGQCQVVPLPTYIDVDDIFEQLDNLYSDECFEYDDFLFDGVSPDDSAWLKGKLEEVIEEFYKKTGMKSTQFTVVDIEKTTE